MMRTVETADDQDLCHAVHICTRATGVLEELMRRAPEKPEILAHLTGMRCGGAGLLSVASSQ